MVTACWVERKTFFVQDPTIVHFMWIRWASRNVHAHWTGWRNGKEQVSERPVTVDYSCSDFFYTPLYVQLLSPLLNVHWGWAGFPIRDSKKPLFILIPNCATIILSPCVSLCFLPLHHPALHSFICYLCYHSNAPPLPLCPHPSCPPISIVKEMMFFQLLGEPLRPQLLLMNTLLVLTRELANCRAGTRT